MQYPMAECFQHLWGQSFMHTIIEQIAGIGVWRMPMAVGPVTLSANACRLLGVENTLPNTLDGLVALCDPEDQRLLRDACERVLNGSDGGLFEVEVRMQVAGRQIWFRHGAQIASDLEDGPALICVLQDLSREKRAIQDATAHLELYMDAPGLPSFQFMMPRR